MASTIVETTDRAGDRNRTRGILVTSEALYQLSYTGCRQLVGATPTRCAGRQLIPPSKARTAPVIIRAGGRGEVDDRLADLGRA